MSKVRKAPVYKYHSNGVRGLYSSTSLFMSWLKTKANTIAQKGQVKLSTSSSALGPGHTQNIRGL